ncbi:class I SAM-dependent methyltransferase [Aurantimonas sp. VKM B-3413]|uniref:class I SAM-dependent methyltransferase n=1 Tax=Aurantimonas sp. VKM B-3413 TaxID=2779401 RepID=UPI001E3669DE|nr:class I SAM-dependent methyltransferase [Aurantimonas sp. VKM B-3413]MCB8839389.1 class I SAM-dependent methyltransferase [Aurantimonas sp. VKM B-3413]
MTHDLAFLYSPVLFQAPQRIGVSAWLEHAPFAFWLIDKLRPRQLVELGTHTGVSFCAFAQAAKQLKTGTACHAVDTWQGDPHAGYYGDDIFTDLSQHVAARYADFAHLVRSTFDEALPRFADGSIDLLHIDGLHTYDAVAHDYQTWLPKVSEGGLILFHDTNVRTRDFGVYRLWAELAAENDSFEFLHGFGLGVMIKGRTDNSVLNALTTASLDPTTTEAIRRTFAYLGEALTIRTKLLIAQQKSAAHSHPETART